MIKLKQYLFLLCGLVLTMSASSVCAQIVEINKRPLQDFARTVKEKADKKDVDLTAPFSIELSGEMNEIGKLDNQKSKFGKATGNPQVIDLAKMGLVAVNDSGALAYLNDLGLKTLSFKISQDGKNFFLVVKSPAATENVAKTDASALNLMLSYRKQRVIAKKNQQQTDDLLLLNGTRIASNGKEVVISIEIPAGEFQQLITRALSKMNKTSGND